MGPDPSGPRRKINIGYKAPWQSAKMAHFAAAAANLAAARHFCCDYGRTATLVVRGESLPRAHTGILAVMHDV
jgi:hypothetical protein